MKQFQSASGVRLKEIGRLSGPAHTPSKLVTGEIEGGILVVGWSVNLQSSFGVTSALRSELAAAVVDAVRDARPDMFSARVGHGV